MSLAFLLISLGIVPHLIAAVSGTAALLQASSAFLPQFVPAHAPHQLERLLILSAVFMVMTFIVFVISGLLAAVMRRHLIGRPWVMQQMRRLFAVSFVGLAAKLATTHR